MDSKVIRLTSADVTRVPSGDVSEAQMIDRVLQALPRMMRADREARKAFLEQAAENMTQLIRDEAEALRRQRAIVIEGHLRGLKAQVNLQAEQSELSCRRALVQVRANAVLDLINDARAMSERLEGDEAQALVADLYAAEIQRLSTAFHS